MKSKEKDDGRGDERNTTQKRSERIDDIQKPWTGHTSINVNNQIDQSVK